MYTQRRKFVFSTNFFSKKQLNYLKNKQLLIGKLVRFYAVGFFVFSKRLRPPCPYDVMTASVPSLRPLCPELAALPSCTTCF